MQYWIFYWGGVGGDGFSNFLEHADNVEPSDGNYTWRILEPDVEDVKFEHPLWTRNGEHIFRDPKRRDEISTITLDPTYVKLIESGINTCIPVHPWNYLEVIEQVPFKDILTKDIFKIFLYSTDTERVIRDFFNKTKGATVKEKYRAAYNYRRSNILNDVKLNGIIYDKFIDIEKVWRDWDYTSTTLSSIGINMSKEMYEEYLDVSKRRSLRTDTSS